MNDALLARAALAVLESRLLQKKHRLLKAEFEREREELRLSVVESAMCRAEIKANRENSK